MNELDKLVAAYKSECGAMSEKQKAESERRIWAVRYSSLGPDVPKGDRREWLASALGGTSAEYEHRSNLIGAGAWADPFWGMADSGASLYTVIRLFRDARKIVTSGQATHEDAVRSVIDGYNSLGYMARSPEGKVFRKSGPGGRTPRPSDPPSVPGPSDRPKDYNFDGSSSQNSRSKKFLSELMSLADSYVLSSLADPDADEALNLRIAKDDFLSYVREAAEDLRRRVTASRSVARKDVRRQRVTREHFRHACEVLNLPYVYGHAVDLRFCKRTMLKRAGPLHPDRNNGSHSAQSEYQAVIESYAVLEKYTEGLKNENGDRNHEGR